MLFIVIFIFALLDYHATPPGYEVVASVESIESVGMTSTFTYFIATLECGERIIVGCDRGEQGKL